MQVREAMRLMGLMVVCMGATAWLSMFVEDRGVFLFSCLVGPMMLFIGYAIGQRSK